MTKPCEALQCARPLSSLLGCLFVWSVVATTCASQAADAQEDAGPPKTTSPSGSAYLHDVWTIDDGLPVDRLRELVQTREGYLWINAEDRLTRFDGLHFTTFDAANTPAFASDEMLARGNFSQLFEDVDGTLWIGTNMGLMRYRNGTFAAVDTSSGLPATRIISLSVDRADTLWVGSFAGLYRREGDRFIGFTRRDGLPGDSVEVVADAAGGVWVVAGGVEQEWIGKTEGPRPPTRWAKLGPRGISRSHLSPAATGGFWIRTGEGRRQVLELYDTIVAPPTDSLADPPADSPADGAIATASGSLGAARARYTWREGLPEERIYVVYEDRSGLLWCGTSRGLYRQVHGRFERYPGIDGEVYSIYEDREGSLWIATFGSGLHRLRPGKFATFAPAADAGSSAVNAVLEDRSGTIWLGTRTGLARLVDGRVVPLPLGLSFDQTIVYALHEDRTGALWAGGYGFDHLVRVRIDEGAGGSERVTSERFVLEGDLGHTGVRVFEEGRAGTLWIGTRHAGLHRYDAGRFTRYTTRDGLPSDEIRALYEDHEGALWVGTNGSGVSRLEGGRFTSYDDVPGLSRANVRTFYEDETGALWIATLGHGLFRYADGRFTRFTTQEGLQADRIYGFSEDDAGHLWMSSDRGVSRVARRELEAVAAGRATRVRSVAFGTDDGMGSQESGSGHPAAVRDQQGRLWFATLGGVAMTDPERQPQNMLPPPVVIERVLVDGAVREGGRPVADGLVMPPGSRRLEFHYVGLSLMVPEAVRYRYRLEGFDRAWSEPSAARSVAYTNLAPGRYTFLVRAANDDGVWNEEGTSLVVTVLPPWWRTVWAYGLYGLLFVLGVVAVDRVQRRRFLAKERERAREIELEQAREIERAYHALERSHSELKAAKDRLVQQEKLASLGALTAGIAHEIKNPLNFVNNFASLTRELVEELREALGRQDAEEAGFIADDLALNAHKIEEHGQRADIIVRSMLEHSRTGAGEREAVDLNRLVEEHVSLAYHGRRAQQPGFEVELERDYDEAAGAVELVPQEIGRVVLNLVTNAFDAVSEQAAQTNGQNEQYAPGVRVSTRRTGEEVEVRVEDNGPGIPEAVRAKIFEPFFTTKPTGKGTGLGLSMAHDIVAQGHGGALEVESAPGSGAAFIVRLPVRAVGERVPVSERG